MHGRPLTPLQRASMLVVAALWLAGGGVLAYIATLGFTALPDSYRGCSDLLLGLALAGVIGAFLFAKSALTPHRPDDFDAEKPDANPDLGTGDD